MSVTRLNTNSCAEISDEISQILIYFSTKKDGSLSVFVNAYFSKNSFDFIWVE